MREALQKETVDWQLQGMGYVPGVYVYGMTDAQAPYILNFTKEGIVFLELNTMCSEYVGHSYIDFEDIEGVSLKKGFIVNTLTILVAGGGQYKYNVANQTMGASWQKENMTRMREFLQKNFPNSHAVSNSKIPVWMCVLIPLLGIGIYTFLISGSPFTTPKLVPEFGLSVERTDEGLHIFTVTTNLPEGTRLSAISYNENGIALSGYRSGYVRNGVVVFHRDSNFEMRYPSRIIFTVFLWPSMQNQTVLAILGSNMENVDSPYLVGDEQLDLEKRFWVNL